MESSETELAYKHGWIGSNTSSTAVQLENHGCAIFRFTLEREIDRAHSHLIYLLHCREQLFGGEGRKARASNDQCSVESASQTEILGGDIDGLTHRVSVYQERLKFQQDRILDSTKRVDDLEREIERLGTVSMEKVKEISEALINEQEKCARLEAELLRAQESDGFKSSQLMEQSQLLDAYIEDVRNLEARLSLIRG